MPRMRKKTIGDPPLEGNRSIGYERKSNSYKPSFVVNNNKHNKAILVLPRLLLKNRLRKKQKMTIPINMAEQNRVMSVMDENDIQRMRPIESNMSNVNKKFVPIVKSN